MESKLLKMARIGVLSALAVVLMLLIRFPIIPSASHLEYEPADAAILIGSFVDGSVAGLIMTFIVCAVQAITVSANGGWVGFVMHFISTGTLVVVASLIYRRFRSKKGTVVALLAGSIAMTLIMIPANLFFTVKFYGFAHDVVAAALPTVIIPFNLIKSIGNSVIVLALHKPLKKFLIPKA